MRPHRLIHDMNKLVLDLYFPICTFGFSFSTVNSINLCSHHLIIIRIKNITMIDLHKNVIRYEIDTDFVM